MITIIDYKAGNIKSIRNMLRKLGIDSIISSSVEDVINADKLILPGVGSFDYGVENLKESGLFDAIITSVTNKTPILGICLGAQLLGNKSDEGVLEGLGLIDMDVVKFDAKILNPNLKIPHMGWADVHIEKPNSHLFKDYDQIPRYYFVHSYHFKPNQKDLTSSSAFYGYSFSASVEKENIFGVQFHPEKSHKYGMQLLKRFGEL